MKEKIDILNEKLAASKLGGGEKRIAKQNEKGKLTAVSYTHLTLPTIYSV